MWNRPAPFSRSHCDTPDSGAALSSSSIYVSPTGSIASRVEPTCSSYSIFRPNASRSIDADCFSESTAIAMCSTRLIFIGGSLSEFVRSERYAIEPWCANHRLLFLYLRRHGLDDVQF